MMFDPRLAAAAALMFPPNAATAFCDPGNALALLAAGQIPQKLFSPNSRPNEHSPMPNPPSTGPIPSSSSSFKIDTLLDQPPPPPPTSLPHFNQQFAVQQIMAQMSAFGATMGGVEKPMMEGINASGNGAIGGGGCFLQSTSNSNSPPTDHPINNLPSASPFLDRHSAHSSAPETPDFNGNCGASSGVSGGSGGGKKARKARTIFTDKQLQELEAMFDTHKYLSVQDRMELARRMNLSDTQVKTWYQNRRTKWKRQANAGIDLLQEQQNLVAVQNLLRSNPQFWAPWLGQIAQHPFFGGQRLLPPGILQNVPPSSITPSIGTTLAQSEQKGEEEQGKEERNGIIEQKLIGIERILMKDEEEGKRKRKAPGINEEDDIEKKRCKMEETDKTE